MSETITVAIKDYEEFKSQLRKEIIAEMESTRRPPIWIDFWSEVGVMPFHRYSSDHIKDGYVEVFGWESQAKNHIGAISRSIHQSTPQFIQRDPRYGYSAYCGRNVYFDQDNPRQVPNLRDLSLEQKLESAELARKITEMYNEYYLRNHATAPVKKWGSDKFEYLPVVPRPKGEK